MFGKLLPCLVTTNLWQNPRIFNEMFHFFIQNVLISQNLSDFKPGDSFDNQILSVTCEIYKSLDDGFDVRSF